MDDIGAEQAHEVEAMRTAIERAAYERCARICEQLGDKEFERLARRGGGIATLAIKHYVACAAAIRTLLPPSS